MHLFPPPFKEIVVELEFYGTASLLFDGMFNHHRGSSQKAESTEFPIWSQHLPTCSHLWQIQSFVEIYIYIGSTHTHPHTKKALKMVILKISFKKSKTGRGQQEWVYSAIVKFRFSPCELLFPVLVHFVSGLAPALRGSLGFTARTQVHLVHLFERLI